MCGHARSQWRKPPGKSWIERQRFMIAKAYAPVGEPVRGLEPLTTALQVRRSALLGESAA